MTVMLRAGEGKCTEIPQLQASDAAERTRASPAACATAFPTAVCDGLLFVWMVPGADGLLQSSQCAPSFFWSRSRDNHFLLLTLRHCLKERFYEVIMQQYDGYSSISIVGEKKYSAVSIHVCVIDSCPTLCLSASKNVCHRQQLNCG
jgi:hypothetical protein